MIGTEDGDSFGLERAAKESLRRQMLALRRALPRDARAARSAAIVTRLLALPEVQNAHVIAIYCAMATEPDLGGLIEWASSGHRSVALPRVEGPAIALHAAQNGTDLEATSFGFRQPTALSPLVAPETVDVIMVPALAIDPRGQRIGHGKGYYDRLLPTLPRARRIGIVFDFQLVIEAPATATDVPVDTIVTDARMLQARPAGHE